VLRFAEVTIGQGGSLRCVRCRPRSAETPTFALASVVSEQLASIASQWAYGPGPNVAFTGVEPFAHPELPAIIGGALAVGARRVRLRTDAGALASPGNAQGVLNAGVHHIEAIVLAGDAALHDELAGRPGLFGAAFSGLAKYRSAANEAGQSVAITGSVPVCRHNAPHVVAAVGALATAGAVCVELVRTDGYRIEPQLVAAAAQAAMMRGVWLHGEDVTQVGITPWVRVEQGLR